MQFRIRFIKIIENHEDLAYGIIWSFIDENLKNENDSSLSETTEKKNITKQKHQQDIWTIILVDYW